MLGLGHGAGTARFGETFGIRSRHPVGRRALLPKSISARPHGTFVEAFLISAMVVGLAEVGDKTQILSMMLAARFHRPLPIVCGILVATLANHEGAGLEGLVFGSLLTGAWMHWVLGISFLSVAVWALFPEKCSSESAPLGGTKVFLATLCAFFVAEIGDKTQLATVGLAARFESFYPVVIGTTLGMMVANVPAVLIGRRAASWLPMKAIRLTAAAAFGALGIATLAS
jgi:Ca2+/H+ antiporter, TMEM165/GDT1 family